MHRKISLYLFLVWVLTTSLSALTLTEHTPQTHPCDFYLQDAQGACTVPYQFVDKTQEQNARYEVTLKAKAGTQTFWITDDSQGVKLKLNNDPNFAIDTALYVPQYWKENPGQCADMSVSNTQLSYALFDAYVEVNRTSTMQSEYAGTMTESWHIGFDGERYIKKSSVLVESNVAGWRNERHGLQLALTGVDSIKEDNADVRDERGHPAKWRVYAEDQDALLSFLDVPHATRLEEHVASKKATVSFFEACDATGSFEVDPQLSLATSSQFVNISSNATPNWTAVYDMQAGGRLNILIVGGVQVTPGGSGSGSGGGLDEVYGAMGESGFPYFLQALDSSASYEVLENSSTRMQLRIGADLISTDPSIPDAGDVNSTITIYPTRLVYNRSIFLNTTSTNDTRSFYSTFIQSAVLNNETLVDNNSIFFDDDIDNAGPTSLPAGFDKLYGQQFTMNNHLTNLLVSQIQQDMFQDDYLQVSIGIATVGFVEGSTDITVGQYNMINVVDLGNDNASNVTAQLRFRDYQTPDDLVFIQGNSVLDIGDEDVDGFNEKEGSYTMNVANARVVFNITNSSGITRFWPAFKVFNYSFNELPQVWVTNSSGTFNTTPLEEFNRDYFNQNASSNITLVQYFQDIIENTQIKICYDCLNPSVINVTPEPNTVYPQYVRVNISANVTDDRGVSTVNASVTYPNGTIITMQLFLFSGDIYNGTFNDTVQLGVYNVTINASDSYGNLNDTEHTNFTIIDVIPPNITNLTEDPGDPAVYSPDGFYLFNATVVDNVAVDQVWIDWNGTNFTGTNISNQSSNYFFNRTPLAAGFYNYTWYANDTSSNQNNTNVQNYTVDKAPTTLTLTITPSNSTEYNVTTTATCTANHNQAALELLRNGSAVANPETAMFVAGSYNYTCNMPESQNYTAASSQNILTVEKAVPELELSLDGIYADITREAGSVVHIYTQLIEGIGTLELFNNGTLINIGAGPLENNTRYVFPLGEYDVWVRLNATQNYTAWNETLTLTLNDTTPPTVVNLTPTGSFVQGVNITITANVTDVLNVSVVFVRVTFPNGSLANYTMNDTNNDSVYNVTFNDTFNTGTYHYLIIANDTLDNVNDTENSTFIITVDEIDVFDLLRLNHNNSKSLFEFKARDIATKGINASWNFTTGESLVDSKLLSFYEVNETIFYFVDYNYSTNGTFNVTALANTSQAEDQETITIST